MYDIIIERDLLNYHGKIRLGLGYQVFLGMKDMEAHWNDITYPVLILHGTADRLTDPAGSKDFIANIKSEDKKLVELDGFYHEIFREPGYEKVLETFLEWINAHMN